MCRAPESNWLWVHTKVNPQTFGLGKLLKNAFGMAGFVPKMFQSEQKMDLSKLMVEELLQFEELHRKAHGLPPHAIGRGTVHTQMVR